ncbi:MAG: NAD(P)/FAD-dependent oxidoreductase [Pseudonocardiales bacterium]
MTADRPLHVLIAGAGLSGLALAQGLLKDGHSCQVFERDPDFTRKTGYMLHMNAYGGEALHRCLPADLYELYLETSRRTPERRESIVLTDQLDVLSSQPHLGPPNEGERPHTGVHRRTLRQILLSRLHDEVRPGTAVVSYEEIGDSVRVQLSDGTTSEGDVLVGADGIRSAVRRHRLPEVGVVDAGVPGIGVYGRTVLTPDVLAAVPTLLLQGVIIAADRHGSRVLLGAFQPRRPIADAAAAIAPDVTLEPVEDYLMVSCSVAPGTVVPPAAEWDADTPLMLREAMLAAVEGWHPAIRTIVGNIELDSIFAIPFGYLEPGTQWQPSRVTLIGDAAHAILPTLGMGANLALNDARMLLDRLGSAVQNGGDLVSAIGAYENDMRELVYPFMRMTMDHDRSFGGGALVDIATKDAPA